MPKVMSCSWMSRRYLTWFGVRPCRSVLRVSSPAFGGTAVRALRLRVISIRPSWISSIDSGSPACS
jgi:hypothetical protein